MPSKQRLTGVQMSQYFNDDDNIGIIYMQRYAYIYASNCDSRHRSGISNKR